MRARTLAVDIEGDYGLIDVAPRWGWCCAICGWAVDPTLRFPHPASGQVDHVVPLAHGGRHALDNLQLAHRFCNWLKHDRLDEFWAMPDLVELVDGAWPPSETYRAQAA